MATRTLGRSVEDLLTALSSIGIEASCRRVGCQKRELIEMQSRQLRRGGVSHLSEIVLGGDRELISVVQPGIVEVGLSGHLKIGDERIPIGHRSPAGPSAEVHAGKSASSSTLCAETGS